MSHSLIDLTGSCSCLLGLGRNGSNRITNRLEGFSSLCDHLRAFHHTFTCTRKGRLNSMSLLMHLAH
ncbi:hypothetical protein D3C74_435810 [compost metagenome]